MTRAESRVHNTNTRYFQVFALCVNYICGVVCALYLALYNSMKRVNFFFPAQMLDRLKRLSSMTGIPAAEILRRALEAALKEGGV